MRASPGTMTRKLWHLALATLTAAACSRSSPVENVRDALEEANIGSVEVAIDESENIVHLQGSVPTIADRTRAEEIASATIGTAGRVRNDITVERLDAPESPDAQLMDRIDRLLDRDPALRERDITIDVSSGSVVISGEVRTSAEKNRVERLVRGTPGVRRIENALDVHAP